MKSASPNAQPKSKVADLLSLQAVHDRVQTDPFWRHHLGSLLKGTADDRSLHLGVFVQPFLGYVLDGRKTVESRFSSVRCAPYEQTQRGDVLLIKRAGGPVVGICLIESVWSYALQPESWHEIKSKFSVALCAEKPEFWEARRHAAYATLMRVSKVVTFDPVPCAKRDRRGWVVLKRSSDRKSLFGDDSA